VNSPTMLLWASLVFGGGGGIVTLVKAVKDVFTEGPARRAEVAATKAVSAKDEAEATAREHETWFVEADAAYRRIDRECKDCKLQLKECNTTIDQLNGRFHRLIDGLDDLCQTSENGMVTIAEVRTVVRAARYAT
jgi:hypothetical protein